VRDSEKVKERKRGRERERERERERVICTGNLIHHRHALVLNHE